MLSSLVLSVVLPFLLYVQVVAKLRGHLSEGTGTHKVSQDTAAPSLPASNYGVTPERYLHYFLEKLKDDLVAASAGQQHGALLSTSQNFKTQAVANLSYKNFAVARIRTNPVDCTGPVVSLAAQNLNCVRFGPMSMSANCVTSSSYDVSVYNSSSCGGDPLMTMREEAGPCTYGMAVQCLATTEVPTFADKEGINTYKFREMGTCKYFATEYLGYNAPYAPDLVEFDDQHVDDDGARQTGNYEDRRACCLPSELLNYCPYPACDEGDGNDGGSAPVGRRLLASTIKTAARSARWWEHTTQETESPASVLTVDSSLWYREYGLGQLRSNVCAYDETYQIWVKTSCSSKKGTHTLQLFADPECHFPMKKVVRPIEEVIPHHGKCVESTKGDGRTMLVLCHDQDGFGSGPASEPPLEV